MRPQAPSLKSSTPPECTSSHTAVGTAVPLRGTSRTSPSAGAADGASQPTQEPIVTGMQKSLRNAAYRRCAELLVTRGDFPDKTRAILHRHCVMFHQLQCLSTQLWSRPLETNNRMRWYLQTALQRMSNKCEQGGTGCFSPTAHDFSQKAMLRGLHAYYCKMGLTDARFRVSVLEQTLRNFTGL